MNYIIIAQTDDLKNGEKKKVSLKDKEILLVNVQNNYYAVDNSCPHMGGSLYEGKLDGANIICPKHGSVFDTKTGKVVEAGRLFLLKVKVKDLKTYALKIEGSDILIGID